MPFPDVVVPTTETIAKDLPSPPRDEFFLPENPNSAFLGILVIFATLTAAYVAADVVLPIFLALILKLLLQPVMRFMSQLHIPRVISATLLIIAAFSVIIALGVIVARPAEDWIRAAPERLPQIQERIKFISDPVTKVLSFLHPQNRSKPPTSQLNSEVQNMGLAASPVSRDATRRQRIVRNGSCPIFSTDFRRFVFASSCRDHASILRTSGRSSILASRSRTMCRLISRQSH